MDIVSTIFIFLFLPAVLLLYYTILRGRRKAQNYFLLLASLGFYAWGDFRTLWLLLACILFNWSMGLCLQRSAGNKKWIQATAVIFNVAILFIYKYSPFAVNNINHLFSISFTIPALGLPLGLSFFIFQCISYICDIAAGRANACDNPLDAGLYISFFPKLIAGPIVRYADFAPQLRERQESLTLFSQGTVRIILGLAKKILLANKLAIVADAAFIGIEAGRYPHSITMAWLGAIGYTLQIYFDFSGYSDIAIGLSAIFGFRIAENFKYPYISASVKDFWHRWHISLSSWFRDYVYIPMGGSRVKKSRWILNMCCVWLLTGIWHGANWTFIIWGLWHLAALLLENFTGMNRKNNVFTHIYTLLVVSLGWVIFRSESICTAWIYIRAMLGFGAAGFSNAQAVSYIQKYAVYFIISFVCATPLIKSVDIRLREKKWYASLSGIILLTLFCITVVYMVSTGYNPFIYADF